jgi:predicted peptidase
VRFSRLFCLSLFAFALAGSPRSSARSHETGFLDRIVSLHGAAYKYQVFIPDNWSPKQKWPIILFLHGSGERGSDGLLPTDVGIAHAIRENRLRFPAIVVIPQCLSDHLWIHPEMEEMAMGALAAASKEFKGDPKRTYLTGLSMGGEGTWYLAVKFPGKFAAIVPICGGIMLSEHNRKLYPELAKDAYSEDPKSYAEVAQKLGKTPIWIFHGDVDDAVSPDNSRNMYHALKTAGGDAHYTEYPGVGHNSWDKAYAEPELLTWLFSKSL